MSPAAARERALEMGNQPPQTATVQTAMVAATPSPAVSASVASTPSAATAETLYIRIGMFRSRSHAHHVAKRLRPRDVHVTRLTRNGRHWYRVWIRGVGDRPDVQNELAAVHSLGYLHARIIAKLETGRHLAQNPAPTVVAS